MGGSLSGATETQARASRRPRAGTGKKSRQSQGLVE